MPVGSTSIEVSTQGDADCIDLTARVSAAIARGPVTHGVAHLFVIGSTAGLTTIEFEPGCVADLATMFEHLAPREAAYRHEERWGDHNGHAHMRASLLGPHLSIPIVDHDVVLGTWQQIILVDFDDRPRERTVVVQLLGD